MENFYKIVKLLKPKYYNRITYLLIITGCSILGSPIWLDLLNLFLQSANDSSRQFTFQIIGQYDWLLGLVIIIIALTYNTIHRTIDLRQNRREGPAHQFVTQTKFGTLEELSLALHPILKDNEYVFNTFGPNSGSIETKPLRTDLSIWNKQREEIIAPNNSKIRELLKININLFNSRSSELAKKMISHIDAFEEHILNPNFDYSEYQFPEDFFILIEETCFRHSQNSTKLKKEIKWTRKQMKRLGARSTSFIGSSLLTPNTSNDLDVVILIDSINQEKIACIDQITFDFKLKFKKDIHITTFTMSEQEGFKLFLKRNKYKLQFHG